MCSPIPIILGIVFIFSTSCNAAIHNVGSREPGSKELFSKVIFEKSTLLPANYTIIFKYIGSEFSNALTFAEVDTNKVPNSTCSFELTQNEDDKEKIMQATINIVNGTDVKVSAAVFGASVSLLTADLNKKSSLLRRNKSNPKTFTVIYKHNATQTRNRKFNLGYRQPGDKLLQFENKNVTVGFRFAEKEFQFSEKGKYITAIGFSMESPTAIAFVNSTLIKDNEFNAIVYDLNTPFFVANMSVFGYDSYDKPTAYKSIVDSVKATPM